MRIYNPVVQTVKGDRVVLHPNYDEVRRNAGVPGVEPISHIHQNAVGFRGADPPADFADRLTIITVGGSTTRSAAQSDDRTWTALLGDAVAACFSSAWINNAGFDGHTSIAHIQLIRDYLIKLHPKVVVMLIGANELYADGLLTQGRGRLRAAAGELTPQVRAELEAKLAISDSHTGISGVVKDLLLRSEVVDLGLTLYRSFRAWQVGLNSWASIEGTVSFPPGGETELAIARELQPSYVARLHVILRLLREGQTISVLMTQPTFGGAGRDPSTGHELSRLWFGLFWHQVFELYNETTRHIAEEENVNLIDLARQMPKDTKYYVDPMHFSDGGAVEVAQLVARELLPFLEQHFPHFSKGNCRSAAAKPS